MISIIIERSMPTMQVVAVFNNKDGDYTWDIARTRESIGKVQEVDVFTFNDEGEMNDWLWGELTLPEEERTCDETSAETEDIIEIELEKYWWSLYKWLSQKNDTVFKWLCGGIARKLWLNTSFVEEWLKWKWY